MGILGDGSRITLFYGREGLTEKVKCAQRSKHSESGDHAENAEKCSRWGTE